jgi:glycosyltransferase 2 family protein
MSSPAWRLRLRAALVVGLKLLVSVGLIWLLVRYSVIDLSQLLEVRVHGGAFALAGTLVLASVPLAAYRWRYLLSLQGVDLPFAMAFRVVAVSVLSGMLLPGAASGEAVRFGYVALRLRDRAGAAVTSVVVDRVIATVGLVALGLALAVPNFAKVSSVPELSAVAIGLALLLIGAGAFVFAKPIGRAILRVLALGHRRRLFRFLSQILESLRTYRQRPKAMLAALALAIVGHGLNVTAVVIIAGTMTGAVLSDWAYAFAMPASSLANLLPLTPGGLGVGEAAFGALCSWLMDPSPVSPAFGTVFLTLRALSLVALIIAAAVGIAWYRPPRLSTPQPNSPGGNFSTS